MRFLTAFLLVILFSCKTEQAYQDEALVTTEAIGVGYDGGSSGFTNSQPPPLYESADYTNNTQATATDSKIIKTANLEFETPDLETTYSRITKAAKSTGASVQRDVSGKGYSRIFRQMVIRVPTENFASLLDSISRGVAYFDVKDISQRDVTEEFVDIQARLKTKRELENRYLELLAKAKNVGEMLEIERELANIREEIEAKQGRLNYLQNQVSLSTINLEFYTITQETGATVSYGRKMGNALKGGWNGISSFFLGLLYLWPLILVIAVAIYFLRRYIKHKKKN